VIALAWLVTACSGPTTAPSPSESPSAPASSPVTPAPSTVASVDVHAPPGFVDVSDVDPTIVHDIRYYSDHNFVGRRIDGYLEPRCLLAEPTARALARAQTAARARGYSLKVYDCYRPARAGQDFVRWARDPDDQLMKGEFYPDLPKSRLFTDGFVGGGATTHSSGTAVDLTLVPLPTPAQRPFVPGEPLQPCTAPVEQRFPDNSIDMGTGYDCFDTRSHTLDGRITGPPRDNRLLLRQLMTDAGFVNYANEWRHYDLADPPRPVTYYDFPVARAALT
jgi:D-alanyl-D-alanine dipeptidase